LSIASEITTTVPAILDPHVVDPGNPPNLQATLNGVATAFQRLGLPLYAIVPRVVHTNNSRPLLEPSLNFPLSLMQAIELQAMFPMGFVATPTQLAAALSIQFERPFIVNVNNVNTQVASTFVRLVGATTQSTTTLRWVPALNTRTWLQSELESGARSIVVELMPSAFGMYGHPQQWTFKLTS
ncbi:MAG TPA: hypothetical protein VM869_02310, partial [Enhygromyxa sp.]|nr:hypothetical protein [Enhygromyxa sp.]